MAEASEKEAVYFLWHFPSSYPDWSLASTLPCGVRTFLSPRPPEGDGTSDHLFGSNRRHYYRLNAALASFLSRLSDELDTQTLPSAEDFLPTIWAIVTRAPWRVSATPRNLYGASTVFRGALHNVSEPLLDNPALIERSSRETRYGREVFSELAILVLGNLILLELLVEVAAGGADDLGGL